MNEQEQLSEEKSHKGVEIILKLIVFVSAVLGPFVSLFLPLNIETRAARITKLTSFGSYMGMLIFLVVVLLYLIKNNKCSLINYLNEIFKIRIIIPFTTLFIIWLFSIGYLIIIQYESPELQSEITLTPTQYISLYIDTITPTLQISSITPSPVISITPTQTVVIASINPPTETVTPTTTPIRCINKDVWKFSKRNPPLDPAKENCYDLTEWGFEGQVNEDKTNIRVVVENLSDRDLNEGIYIDYYNTFVNFNEIKISFDLTLYELTSHGQCGGDPARGDCDVNFVIGVGNPKSPDSNGKSGNYIVFRDNDGTSGWICNLKGLWSNSEDPSTAVCISENRISDNLELEQTYNFQFTITKLLVEMKITDKFSIHSIKQQFLPVPENRLFWIGYYFRNEGIISLKIENLIIEKY